MREPNIRAPFVPPPGLLAKQEVFDAARKQPFPQARQAQPPVFRQELSRMLTDAWRPVLARLGLARWHGESAAARAAATGTTFVHELLGSGEVGEVELFRAVAAELGLPFAETVDPDMIFAGEEQRLASLRDRRGLRVAAMRSARAETIYLVADPAIDPAALKAKLVNAPHLRRVLCIAPPSALRTAMIASSRNRLLFDAQHSLLLRSPEFSARTVVTAWQGAAAVGVVSIFLTCLWMAPLATFIVFHSFAAIGFAACVVLRLLAYRGARPLRLTPLAPVDPAAQPVYSVLVALYREKEVLPQLLAALGRLQWPRSRLEIKLVCEADDIGTLEALKALPLEPCMEVVLVPPGLPRTKPKALSYALPLCSGEIVTLYDAEDRPDPLQLVEAWQRFSQEGPELACLQAPLVITNGEVGAVPLMFAFEYAGLFRGLLPWLGRRRLMLPLGGTSNHFRRAVLDEVGGWDSYNVTEDAELGVRLCRYGYRSAVITRPTYEDAPETVRVWLPQRVRWFKGWLQTWLVHIREPVALWRELGPASFLVMQIMSIGMVISALVHPIFLSSIVYVLGKAVWTGSIAGSSSVLAALGLASILCGYGAFILLGLATMMPAEKTRPIRFVIFTPLHWLLLSAAAWVALWDIYRRPHHWSKTPHVRRATQAAG